MGADANCALRANGVSHPGRALLETDELIFRGSDGYRLKLPLESIRNVRAADGELLLDGPDGSIAIELGDKADRWAERIRSPKSLLDKLDLKPSHAVSVIGGFDKAFEKQLSARVNSVTVGRTPNAANVVFLWTERPTVLKRLGPLRKMIARDGAIWVIHPKGAPSKVKDTDVLAEAKRVGLTAMKVAKFSDTHTAEKLVIPVAHR